MLDLDNLNDKKYNNLLCINDQEILNIEKKLFSFSLDKNYNYASCIINSENTLPKINIDFSSLKIYFKDIISDKNKNNEDILIKELFSINNFYSSLTSNINLEKTSTIGDQSIIYYLFHIMNYILFYILLNPNVIINKSTSEIYLTFFSNYYTIKNAAELYINRKIIKDSNYLINNNNQLIEEYYELANYKDIFEEIVKKCNNLLAIILNSIGYPKNNEEKNSDIKIDEKMMYLFEKFILVFNIFHSINEKYNIIDYKCFYNESLSKNLNLEREFQIYLNNEKILKERNNMSEDNKDMKEDEKLEFTLLSYTWLFDPSAKYEIINLFNEDKQINQVSNLNFHDLNNDFENMIFLGVLLHSRDFFFKLNIRRDYIIEDTLNEISKYSNKLQNPLKVEFIGEEAEDEGGVRKEFFMLVTRKLFDVNYGMFTYNEKTRLFWFNINSFEAKVKFELIGIVLGLALFNGIILDVKFPMAIYKKLLGIKPCLNDLKEYDPELYNNLYFLINTDDKNLKENLDTTFTVTVDFFGEKKIIPLKPNGENILIDYDNKNEYVDLYVNWFFNESINEFYVSFEKGFYRVFDKKLSKILSPQELELIICGTQKLDFNELKKSVKYEDYNEDSITVKYFWQIVMEFNEEEKKKFLFFVTGCDRAPIDGLGSLPFAISRNANVSELPSAHTCFNNLILPDYKNKDLMKKKIQIAINYSEGFGLA